MYQKISIGLLGLAILSGCASSAQVPPPQNSPTTTSQATVGTALGTVTSTGTIIDHGYRVTNEPGATPQAPSVVTFTSPNGKRISLPPEIERFLNDYTHNRHLTSLDIPIDPTTPSLIYLSTSAPLNKDFTSMDNRLFRFSLLTQELSEIYGEKTQNATLLRTVGREGSFLIVARDSVNASPGVCATLWYEFRDKLWAFDLEHPEQGLLHYVPPTDKIAEALKTEQACLNAIH